MSFIAISTANPLGRRPLNLMARSQSLGWLGQAAAPTPGDYDNNQGVLNALVSMGAISLQDASDILNGQASLDDMAVNMTMINQALQISGQQGAATPTALPASSTSGGVDASSESSWNAALNYLQEWNAVLKQVSAIAMQHPNDPSWTAFDTDLLNNQNQYNSTSNTFNTAYRAVYGHVAPGLSGWGVLGHLGQFDPVTAAGFAALLIGVTGAAIAGYEYAQALRTRAQAQLQQTQSASAVTSAAISQANALRQQAATAAAQGNAALAAQLNAQANALMTQATNAATTQPGGSPSITAWLSQNTGILVMLALGITLGPPLIKKLF